MQNIEKNLNDIHARINTAAIAANRNSSDIALLAVSKRKPVEDIRRAYACGQRDFGENYLQEAQQKMADLSDLDIHWHFIASIQSNKTKPIAEAFQWVHCIDRLKIAKRLSEQRPPTMPPLNVCIQVNIEQEASKSGIKLDEVDLLAEQVAALPNLKLRGLMAIPTPQENYEAQRKPFAQLRQALEQLNHKGFNCDTLSMGMTHDIDAAIAEGATLVRIGTAIFGERS